MFSKAKNQETETQQAATTAAVEDTAKRNSGRSKRASRPAGVPSIVSADMVIKGSIESGGEVQFDGEIHGDIKAKGLVIGDGARVDGEVMAEKVRVSGTVEGSIRAVEVELASSAFVKGDITHKSLTIESGARFDGSSQHSDDPMSAPSNRLSAPRSTPAEPIEIEADIDEEYDDEYETNASARPQPQRLEAPQARELMPARNTPSPERPLLKRPSPSSLR